MRWAWILTGAAVIGGVGCGGDEPPMSDGGPPVEACVDDVACDDGVFCNGVERCAPDAAEADAFGCVRGDRPCAEAERCVEEMQLCRASCDVVADADGDGHDAIACGGADCDDTNASAFPGNVEVCDELDVDEDCDPATFGSRDQDGDGFVDAACCNALADGTMSCGRDCGDLRRDVRPGNTEACDGLDNDCDADVDEGVLAEGFADGDLDLHGDSSMPMSACPDAPGFSIVGDDCDDTDSDVHGAQLELCDGKDNDCDGTTDESPAAVSWYPDEDADGFGTASGTVVVSCTPVEGYSLRSSDCDDADREVNPAAREVCNGRDDDCDGTADATIEPGNTEDDDGDGFPDMACGGNDCDDSSANVYPGAPELCDGIDNDCDGVVDGADAMAQWYLDLDGDGFGDESQAPIESCEPQPMRVPRGGDCDDADASVRPGVRDPCGGGDQDCDGELDESGVRFAYYVDSDGDGFGDGASAAVFACEPPSGRSGNPSDCDDASDVTYPGAPERCDEADNDCDEAVDEDAETQWYPDSDSDGSGAMTGAMETCTPPDGYVTSGDDCDDFDPLRAPSISERCDGVDNDCDTTLDEGADATCEPANGAGSCVSAACQIDACDPGFEDCDFAFETGCEVDTRRDPFNCGGCGSLCGVGDTCGTSTAGSCDASPWVQLMLGDFHSMALRASGGTAVWGENADGQLGDGSTTDRHSPVRGPFGFVQLEASDHFSCGRTAAGRVMCWGENSANGHLGNGDIRDRPVPVRVEGLSDIVDLSVAREHSCAIEAGGQVWCWGENRWGQLGNLGTETSLVPVAAQVTDAIQVLAGGGLTTFDADSFSCALRPLAGGGGNRVSCWGANDRGQLGDGNLGASSSTPVDVLDLPADVVELADGPTANTVCARTGSGNVYCWGIYYGNGTASDQPTAVIVSTETGPLSGAVRVAAGYHVSCALLSTGAAERYRVWCWGNNTDGALGRNSTAGGSNFPPAPVVDGAGAPIEDARLVGVGARHGCVVRSDESVWCWGDGLSGQIGDGDTGDHIAAIQLPGLP